jgi:hypothetical protein
MKIGILSKRTTGFVNMMKKYLENIGHSVKIYLLDNLCINESLFENDFYILKSKKLFFLYAGYYLEKNNIQVVPNPDITYKHKNRIEAHFLIKKAGLLSPKIFFGTFKTIKNQIKLGDYPLILKPLMGSGSRGVKRINSIEDLESIDNQPLYLEKYIIGTHYLVYFIADEIYTLEKPPLLNEHVNMKEALTIDGIREVIIKWKNCYDLLFGHLDIVIENITKKIYIVDPGSFPEFSNWKYNENPVPKICNLILERYKNLNM